MQNYDSTFIDLFVPLIVVQVPDNTDYFKKILAPFDAFRLENNIWDNSILKNRLLNTKFKIDIKVDSNTLLNELAEFKEEDKHSRLSPFNTKSDLFPNGILSHKWFHKYRCVKPFTFIQVLELPNDSRDDDAFTSKINEIRNSYGQFGIRYVCIIASNTASPQEDESRLTKIRQLTGLTRLTGALYINCKEENLEKDADILVTGLLSNLKNVATEFYKGIETKLKQRSRKYYSIPSSTSVDTTVELTPKFLETRNLIKQAVIQQYIYPHNLESSIKLFELSYQNLIQIIQNNFFEFTKDNISEHDFKLYTQFRILVDIVAFHIVRSYLSLEDPVTALKKHSAHILNVTSATKGNINLSQWMSIQYEWLAELLSILPKSILARANIRSYNNKHKNLKAINYFGGIRFDDGSGDVTLNPGLIYLTAESQLVGNQLSDDNQLDFLKIYKTEKEIVDKKLNLLERAVKTIDLGDENSHQLSVYKYLCYLLANSYYETEDYLRASEMYEISASDMQQWTTINDIVHKRLMLCYVKIGNYDSALLTSLAIKKDSVEQIDIKSLSSTINFDKRFFEINTLFTSTNNCEQGIQEVYVFDSLTFQLSIRPKFELESLAKYLGEELKYSLTVNKIVVNYDIVDRKGFKVLKSMIVNHDSSLVDNELQITDNGIANLSFYLNSIHHQNKIVETTETAANSGIYQLTNISVEGKLKVEGSKTVEIIINDEWNSEQISLQDVYDWYHKKSNGKLVKLPIQRSPSLKNSVNVLPIKPIIRINNCSPNTKSIILGEKIILNFDIALENKRKLNYNLISLLPRAKIVSEKEEDIAIEPKISWNDMKDDEALILSDLENTLTRSSQLKLSIYSTSLLAERVIRKSSTAYKVIFELKAIVQEDGFDSKDTDSHVVYDVFNQIIDVINSPFVCRFSISPKYREGSYDDIPSPFILPKNEKILSMPIVTRVWQGNFVIIDQLVKSQGKDNSGDLPLEVLKIDYNIKPNTSDILLELMELSTTARQKLFTTKSKSGIPHRNVTVVASGKIEWRRHGSESINVFETDDWEITLPLADPRVLLQIEKSSEIKKLKLKYIIENPTPRIFTFSSKLVDENERFIWNFDNNNMFPLTQPKFHVLPFNRYTLEYNCGYNSTESIIQLPQLKTFDIQYKVSLPTLPVSDDITIKDNNTLYWKVK